MNYPINRAITHWPGNDDVFVVVRHYGYLRDFTKIDAAKYRSIDKIFEEEINFKSLERIQSIDLNRISSNYVVAHFFYIDQVFSPSWSRKKTYGPRTNGGDVRITASLVLNKN